MQTSALALITDALLDLGAIDPGESVSSADATIGLRRLQLLIDGWNLQSLTLLTTSREVFSLTANVATYSIGSGQTWDADRPAWGDIQNTTLLLNTVSPATEIPLPLYTEQGYEAVPVKDLTSTLPTGITYEQTFPYGTFTLYPVPTDATNQVVLYRKTLTTNFTALNTAVQLAPMYAKAIGKNLAVDLADVMSRPLPATMATAARETLAILKQRNYEMVDLGIDPAYTQQPRGVYNIYSDT